MNDRTLPTEDPSKSINVDGRGNLNYDSAAATGHIEVEIPSLPGSQNSTERMLAKDFGSIALAKIESSINRQGYIRTGPVQSPAQVLEHYIAVAKGSKLVQPAAISHLERLAKEFAGQKEADRQTYFETMIRPALLSLTPTRRR